MKVWVRVLGGYGLYVKSVSEMGFSERYGHKRTWRIGSWIIGLLKRGRFEKERLKWRRIYWAGTRETLVHTSELRRIDEVEKIK